ncbi:WD40-repeat-containing domain protein [Calycina marina]|uniref:WD40-repeat-containing domain protein n=1 Tax=Calycina marina TaxID=1763456 RepID=A0A9P8CHY2_9HELO|nr:WD40-repeat-containing domain protein [Calycina marina]
MEEILSPTEQEGFTLLQYGHRDMAEAVSFNYYGDRFASSSVDGKIKVYNRHKDGTWNLSDTWGAHTAQILEIHWLPPSIHPNLLASIGTDGKFKLWVEDATIAPGKGRRFNQHNNTPVWELRSPPRAPFLSFSIKHNCETRHTYLALIKRNAELTIYENDRPENLDSWTEIDSVKVCEKPVRGEETTFKVGFDPNLSPCYNAIHMGVSKDALGLIVASMERVTIWRTKEVAHNVSLGSSTSKELYMAIELKGHRGLIRDVAWAPGNPRGYDIVATACKDGFVRVFQITTPTMDGRQLTSKDYARPIELGVAPASRSSGNGARNPSGIGSGLAGARTSMGNRQESDGKMGEVVHAAKEVSKLDANRNPVWRVDFDEDGQLLGSTGDDGKLMLYRREPNGVWSRSAELALIRGPMNGRE